MVIHPDITQIRIAQLAFYMGWGTHRDTIVELEAMSFWRERVSDAALAKACADKHDPLHFRTILTALIDDIFFRSPYFFDQQNIDYMREVLQSQFYNIIAETGVSPAYLEDLIYG